MVPLRKKSIKVWYSKAQFRSPGKLPNPKLPNFKAQVRKPGALRRPPPGPETGPPVLPALGWLPLVAEMPAEVKGSFKDSFKGSGCLYGFLEGIL